MIVPPLPGHSREHIRDVEKGKAKQVKRSFLLLAARPHAYANRAWGFRFTCRQMHMKTVGPPCYGRAIAGVPEGALTVRPGCHCSLVSGSSRSCLTKSFLFRLLLQVLEALQLLRERLRILRWPPTETAMMDFGRRQARLPEAHPGKHS